MEPAAAAAKHRPQALAWNIGTASNNEVVALIAKTSGCMIISVCR